MPKVRLYAVSMKAIREVKPGDFGKHPMGFIEHTAKTIIAENLGIARDQAKSLIYTLWPTSEGWSGHSITVMPPHNDLIGPVTQTLERGELSFTNDLNEMGIAFNL